MPPNLPDSLALREIKYGAKTSPALQSGAARAFIEAGRLAEGLDLLLLAGDEAGIEELRRRAVNEGRPLLLLMLRRAEREVLKEEWRAAGRAASNAGRWREAYRCFIQAEDEEGLAEVREKLPDYSIYTPQGK